MVREIITINLGQCGINLGDSIWRRYNAEINNNNNNEDCEVFFYSSENTIYPRTLLIDTEPHIIDEVINNNKSFYNKEENIFALKNHESNIFSRGYNKLGKILMNDMIENKLQKLVEGCDNFDGIILNRGISGGTGSGLGSLILEHFSLNYKKKNKVSFDIYPILRNLFSYSLVEPYNMILALHWLLDYSDLSFVFDNDAIYKQVTYNKIKQPNYDNLNAEISEQIALITSTLRHKSTTNINENISEMISNLVPFPRLHFMFSSKEMDKTIKNHEMIFENMLNKTSNFSIQCDDYDNEEDKFMSLLFHCGGNNYYNQQTKIQKIVEEYKSNRLFSLVEWCPTGTKFAFSTPNTLNNVDEAVLIGNNTCIARYFNDVIATKFDLLWHERSYIHWFIRDGMEEGEFLEAREDVGFLEKDYLDVLSEQASDECDDDDSEDCIGFSVGGGAKDTNNFINNVKQRRMPTLSSITYQGTFYQYLFDTKTNKRKCIDMNGNNDDDEKKEDKPLFYPTYCYSKSYIPRFLKETENNQESDEYQYYMTIGLNSTIKQSDFKRKKLNLLVILDKSGSMSCSFDGEWNTKISKSKMNVANKSVVSLLKHLNDDDRFGLISFDNDSYVHQRLDMMGDIKMDKLRETIMSIKADGGTNFEIGYKKAIQCYSTLFMFNDETTVSNINDYENRVIMLTDACPNCGTDSESLLNLVKKCAEDKEYLNGNRIYTTFIGIGLDFNNTLIEEISNVRGSNYYSVHSNIEFKLKMDEEFEYMVTPLVFNLNLSLKSEGNSCTINNVYGCNENQLDSMINNGEIQNVKTLFPSKKNKGKGGTKGGIILIQLKLPNNNNDNDNNNNDAVNVEMYVEYEDRNGNIYKNNQFITLDTEQKQMNDFEGVGDKNEEKIDNVKEVHIINDMIENDENDENVENVENDKYDDSKSYYDNSGICKGILLSRYVTLIKQWIQNDTTNNPYAQRLYVSKKYKLLFKQFKKYILSQMKILNDPTLKQECDILEILINS